MLTVALPFLTDTGFTTLTVKPSRSYTREEYAQWSAQMSPLRLEILPDQSLVIMSPVSTRFGRINSLLNALLSNWALSDGLGDVFDSSTGFDMPDGSNRSPDASWVLKSRVAEAEQQWPGATFYKLCPDFVVELRSPSDVLAELKEKMEMYLRNGARLGWLIDPVDEKAYIYQPGRDPQVVDSFNETLDGGTVLPGFRLALHELRVPGLTR